VSRLPVSVEKLGSHWTDFVELFQQSAQKIQVLLKILEK
jgi:hypothetical protein